MNVASIFNTAELVDKPFKRPFNLMQIQVQQSAPIQGSHMDRGLPNWNKSRVILQLCVENHG